MTGDKFDWQDLTKTQRVAAVVLASVVGVIVLVGAFGVIVHLWSWAVGS